MDTHALFLLIGVAGVFFIIGMIVGAEIREADMGYKQMAKGGGKRINGNHLAVAISKAEGKKKQVDIAQIKEVVRCCRLELKKFNDMRVLEWIRRN